MQTKLLTVKEVAKRINKSVSTIYSYCREYYDNGQGNGPRLRKRKFIKPLRIGSTTSCNLKNASSNAGLPKALYVDKHTGIRA